MKRTNDNSQVSKENYNDNNIANTVEHGMTKATAEVLKRRRTVNVTATKKWNAFPSPGTSMSESTNPFAKVKVQVGPTPTSANAFAKVKTKPFASFGVSSNKATVPVDQNINKKMALLEDIQDTYDEYKGDADGFVDLVKGAMEKMKKADWEKVQIVKYPAQKEEMKSVEASEVSSVTVKTEEKKADDTPKPNNTLLNETVGSNDNEGKVICNMKAKIYKDSIPSTEWKDFGTGNLKLIQKDKYQLLVREANLGKPIVNILISKGMKIIKEKNFIMLVAVMDEIVGPEKFMFKVNLNNIDKLFGHLNDIVK